MVQRMLLGMILGTSLESTVIIIKLNLNFSTNFCEASWKKYETKNMFLACAWENEKLKLIFLLVAYPIAANICWDLQMARS